MAKNDLDLNLNVQESQVAERPSQGKSYNKKQPNKKGGKGKGNLSAGQRIAKFFREIISELKKVDWPPIKRTKNNPGVLVNTSIVLVVVAFFLVVITAFDFGLLALLRLLTGIQG
jgi:preprotein translocase subunit SecE